MLIEELYQFVSGDRFADMQDDPRVKELFQFGLEKYQNLQQRLFFRKDDANGEVNIFRPSLLGKCGRKLAYIRDGLQSTEPMQPRGWLSMLYGDMSELIISILLRAAVIKYDLPIRFLKVEPASIEIAGIKIIGICDDLVETIDRQTLLTVFEYKALADAGFKKQELNIEIDNEFGYTVQHYLYMLMYKAQGGLFLALNKNVNLFHAVTTPELPEGFLPWLEEKVKLLQDKTYKWSRLEAEVDKNGKLKLRPQCVYCEYKTPCWEGVKVVKELENIYPHGKRYVYRIEEKG